MGLPGLDHIESRRVLGWLTSAWIVLGVLALDPRGYSPFGPIKWSFAITLLAAAAAAGVSGKVVVHRTAMRLWALIIGWTVLSAVLGVDKFHAWVGTPTRRFGVVAWVLCMFAFVLGHQIVLKRQGELVHKALIVAGLGLGVYAVGEALGAAPVELAQFSSRLGSTYGSPAYLGAATALLFPILLGISATFEGPWRFAAYSSAVAVLFASLGSGTRASWVGLGFAALMVVAVAPRVLVLKPSLLFGGIGLALAAVIATPVGSRLSDALDFSQGTSRGRLDEWQVGLSALAKRPFSGAGPEGYRVVFGESVTQTYAQTYGRDQIVDRAHNGLLDIGLTIGIPGMLLVVVLFVVVGRVVFEAFRSRDPMLVGTGAALLAYLVQQQFLFPVAEIDPLAWFMAGMLMVRIADSDQFTTWKPSSGRQGLAFTGALVAIGLLAGVLGFREVEADAKASDALAAASQANFTEAQNLAWRAGDLRPDSTKIAAVQSEVFRLSGDHAGLEWALEANARGLQYSPRDPGLLAGRGALLLASARLDESLAAYLPALAHWESLVVTDPNNGRFQLQLGVAYAGAQQLSSAEQAWIRAATLSPKSVEARVNLGLLYAGAGQFDKASEQLNLATEIDPDHPGMERLRSLLEGF